MITKPKGTKDIYGIEAKKWQHVLALIHDLCEKYNYTRMRTPVFESSELFHRGVGETTDIVTKETYDFVDRGNRPMTLRPEGTAGVVRSFIENKMHGDAEQPKKFYYVDTMYRYERPQSGRLREHTQFGVEVLGTDEPVIDAEIISLAVNLYQLLGLKGIKVNLNSLGDKESRENYKKVLIDYLKPHIKDLCPDCQTRYEKNPLRVLDCKADMESDILKNVPLTINHLNDESKKRFEAVQEFLGGLDIEYGINHKLVRGFDYYNHTIFEIEANIEGFGSHNVLCGGGRYNGLVETLGGPETPGIGFGMGIERLLLALDAEEVNIPIRDYVEAYIMYVNDEEKDYASYLANNLRANGIITEIENMGRGLKGQFKQADRLNAKFLVILNSDDLRNEELNVKDNLTKEEAKIKINDLVDYLDSHL